MNSTSVSATTGALHVGAPAGFRRVAFEGLASGASWTLAASVTAALSQWLLLMVTAKLGSAEMVGQLALSFAIVAPIQALTDMALRPALATDARRDFHFNDYLDLRMKMIAVAVITIAAAAWWRGGATASIIVAVGLQKAAESASDLFYGLFQREERLRWMGQSVVIRSTLASVAFVGVMLAYGDLLSACLAGVLVRVGTLLLHDLPRGSGLTPIVLGRRKHPRRNRIGELFRKSLPLAAGVAIMAFTVNLPRYFVEKRMGVAALGIFAALIYVFQAGAMLIDAVSQAACARLAQHHLLGEYHAFRLVLWKLIALALTLAGGGIVIAFAGGGPLLRIAYSAAFAGAAKPFLWLSVCAIPWYCSSVFGYALMARRQMSAFFYCQVASLGVTIAGSYWLITAGGGGPNRLTEACLVVFLTYFVQLALYGAVLWRGDTNTQEAMPR
ncbi:MAG TPA: lipopolysaccharide biosynthesis protein [Bryobacteraceae bacterium]|jgi:O-antigen/teichoic acid export membrane protein